MTYFQELQCLASLITFSLTSLSILAAPITPNFFFFKVYFSSKELVLPKSRTNVTYAFAIAQLKFNAISLSPLRQSGSPPFFSYLLFSLLIKSKYIGTPIRLSNYLLKQKILVSKFLDSRSLTKPSHSIRPRMKSHCIQIAIPVWFNNLFYH